MTDNTASGVGVQVPNKSEAERHLELLDPFTNQFTFQIFHDSIKGEEAKPFAKILHGTLDQHMAELTEANAKGCGIFVTVQETTLQGRTCADIVRIRAVFREMDRTGCPLIPLIPHFIIESSPGKFHEYIKVEGLPVEAFRGVQQRLVDDYGSDPAAKDTARVLRLAGFCHLKNPNTPHLVRIVQEADQPDYPATQLAQILPPVDRTTQDTFEGTPNHDDSREYLEIARLRRALEALNTYDDYVSWIRIGMATKAASNTPEMFREWEKWSARGYSFREGACAYKWNSFSRKKGDKVSLGSLFHDALKAGWDGGYRPEEAACREDIKEEARRLQADFASKYRLAEVEGKVAVVSRLLDRNVQLEGRYKSIFAPFKDFNMAHETKMYPVAEYVPKDGDTHAYWAVMWKSIVEQWRFNPGRKQYSHPYFMPHSDDRSTHARLPDGEAYNLYLGLALTPVKGTDADIDKILFHIREVWCKNDLVVYSYVLNLMARMFQLPGEQGHVVVVLKSEEGAGKNIILDMFTRAFGVHAFVPTKSDDVTGRFNASLAVSVFVFMNEALWGGDKKSIGAYKSMSTDDTLSIELKFINKFQVRNCTHLWVASNSDWIAPVGMGDRRHLMLELSEEYIQDLVYFGALKAQIEGGGREKFIQFLLDRDISDFQPRTVPVVAGEVRIENQLRSADSVTEWWHEQLMEETLIAFETDEENWVEHWVRVPTDTIHAGYLDWCEKLRKFPEPKGAWGKKIQKLCPGRKKRQKVRPKDGVRLNACTYPPLGECRAAFDRTTRNNTDWPQTVTEEEDNAVV